MGCKSALYATNTSTQALTTGNVINFGNIIRRFGCQTNLSGGNVVLRGIGYYKFNGNVVLLNTGTDEIDPTVTFYKDGVIIPGAVAQASIQASGIATLSVPFILRETCDCESTITAIISNASATVTVTVASVAVEKL